MAESHYGDSHWTNNCDEIDYVRVRSYKLRIIKAQRNTAFPLTLFELHNDERKGKYVPYSFWNL